MAIAPVLSVSRPPGPTSGPPPSQPEQEIERLQHQIRTQQLDSASALALIARRLCELTRASGAAIALQTEGSIVCVASHGNAPDVGVTLDQLTGLSGECIRTGALVHCRDAQTDPRINPVASLRLQLGSAVVLPIRKGEDWVGIVEILSGTPDAFHGSAVLFLQKVAELTIAVAATSDSEKPASPSPVAAAEAAANFLPAAVLAAPGEQNGRTKLATALPKVPPQAPIKTGRQLQLARRLHSTKSLAAIVVRPLVRSALLVWLTAALLLAGFFAYWSGSSVVMARAHTASGAGARLDLFAELNGLTREALSLLGGSVGAMSSRLPATDTPQLQTYSPTGPVVTSARLLESVQPIYPQAARAQGLRGTVLLRVRVAKDGQVQQVSTIRGNSILAAAATDAIKRWRYRPFLLNDQPVEGEIVVSINFLPPSN